MVCPHSGILLGHIKDEVLIHVTKQVSLKNLLPKSQTQKTIYCTIPFLQGIQSRQIRQSEDGWLPGIGGGNGSKCKRAGGISWEEGDTNVLKLISGDGGTTR